MRRSSAVFYWLLPVGLVACLLFAAAFIHRPAAPSHLLVTIDNNEILADGSSTALIAVRDDKQRTVRGVSAQVIEGSRRVRIAGIRELTDRTEIAVQSTTDPGEVQIRIGADTASPASISLRTRIDTNDSFGDGTPDFLRLGEPGDRKSFREWFTFLAEYEASRSPDDLSQEINDCAALIRYAYRESLREHDGNWASGLRLAEVPGTPSIQKYSYPYTALGAALYRVREGKFDESDLRSGSFAQFADAESLRRFNTYFVSRELSQARPGDLLFYRQLGQRMPYHAMIFIGSSHFEEKGKRGPEPNGDGWLVYHTGPDGNWKGEIRRVRVSELLNHPDPRWRPYSYNRNFLGVYRWNILRVGND